MQGYGPSTFGDSIADVYDTHYALEVAPSREKVEVLSGLAAGGRVLDVGCGTGHMAIALAREGLDVTGVDVSGAMIRELRANDPKGSVIGKEVDITQQPVEGGFDLAYMLFETLIMVGGEGAQRAALENVAQSLNPGGKLLVEVSIMELRKWADHIGSTVRVSVMRTDCVGVGISQYDREEGRLDYQDVIITENGIRLLPVTMHPCSPSELNARAKAAGLVKRSHWSDWTGRKYSSGDPSLVAVYDR